jgi:electron transfer flavoprotein alpha subunit
MKGILVVTQQTGGVWHKMSFEALAAGQQLAHESGEPVFAAVIGGAPLAARVDRIYSIEHELLAHYTADGYTEAVAELIRKVDPAIVLFPHTYEVRDYAPKLATRFGQSLVSDVIGFRLASDVLTWQRQLYQGKLNADFRPRPGLRVFASIQAGCFRGENCEKGQAPVERVAVTLDASAVRQKPEAAFRESARGVDLTAAELIVSVGRGIKEKENIGLVEDLAKVMGAELAASRPICDSGWLPMERQVGSSGQTVSPKVYLAVGISGAIQHLVGMKGAKTIVAINRDPNAPIFEVADYGIVGDLFDVVPALIEEIKKVRT